MPCTQTATAATIAAPSAGSLTDMDYMQLAMLEAQKAYQLGEVPVGAVLVRHGKVIASGHNRPISTHDPSAHAEMMALREAGAYLGNYRLPECELFVTLEPCAMCAGAMLHARLKRVIFGAADPKTGVAGSVLDLFSVTQLNHQTTVLGGVLADGCSQMLKDFFAERRLQKREVRSGLVDTLLRTTPDASDPGS